MVFYGRYVKGGRETALKEATKAYNSNILKENVEYKPKEEYDCDGYKYKDKDCYEYGNSDKFPYPILIKIMRFIFSY